MMFIGLGVRGSRWAVGLDTGRRVDDDEDNAAVRPQQPPATSHQPLPAHNDHFLWQLDPGSPASTRLGEAALCAQVVTGWGPVTSQCHICHLAAVWVLTAGCPSPFIVHTLVHTSPAVHCCPGCCSAGVCHHRGPGEHWSPQGVRATFYSLDTHVTTTRHQSHSTNFPFTLFRLVYFSCINKGWPHIFL